jgi:hypothetical protein
MGLLALIGKRIGFAYTHLLLKEAEADKTAGAAV